MRPVQHSQLRQVVWRALIEYLPKEAYPEVFFDSVKTIRYMAGLSAVNYRQQWPRRARVGPVN